jgi:hypothetical protein
MRQSVGLGVGVPDNYRDAEAPRRVGQRLR